MEHKSTILIVDDNIAGRETLKGLLFGRGYNLLFAADGVEALQKAEQFTPDLILLDVMMPGMDGYEVCQHLRANPKVAEVPVIMVTALDDRDSRLRGIEAGADDFVSKPFDHAELRKRVQTITRLNRYRRLLSERTKFEWVVEQADDGYVIINQNDKILYANSQARLYLNLPPGDNQVPAQPFLQLVQTQYNAEPAAAWAMWPGKATASLPRYLVRPATANANPFWLQVDNVDMNAGDTEEHLIRLRDVTTKVSDQRSMWTFHGQISHKLRTPLNHLFASLDMIDDADLACTNEDTRTFFSIARHGATRLKNELQDILQFIDAPQLVNADVEGCRPTDITNIVKNISNLLDLQPPTLSFKNLDPAGDYQLILGAQAVELILWELMENAKKFHPEQSPVIDITVSRLPNQYALIQVGDNGLTLSPDQLENMWAPYYQAEKYFTGQVGGTGLGLSLVTSLIWGVGGNCSSHNRANQPGIVIELTIPPKISDPH
ncbi:MAG: response regulator [Chloroflexi bacterium]|nr:MAG: response regulator [Chloroflexota bacterium]